MANYQVYNVNNVDGEMENYSLADMGILNIKNEIEYEEIEIILDNFIKNNFPELYHELIELVLVDIKTNKAVYRFNLVFELDESNNPIDQTLRPFVDHLESSFKYEFLQAYYNTYNEELRPNAPIKIIGVQADINFLLEDVCSASKEDCKKYKNICIECISNKYNLKITYTE